jgi:hypothetical protein
VDAIGFGVRCDVIHGLNSSRTAGEQTTDPSGPSAGMT